MKFGIKEFSIILPVLNEEKNIKKLIFLLKKNLQNLNYEIIFVDDNSSDNTRKIIAKFLSKKIKYYLRKTEKDLSLSCMLGIEKSKYKSIVIMDADLQHNPKYLIRMLSTYFKKKYDFLIGTRNFELDGSLSLLRYLGSRLIICIYGLFLKPKLRDPMSGFFIFKKKIYFRNKKKLYAKGFKILADLFYNEGKIKYKEYEIKFDRRIKNKSKMNFKVLINVIKLLLYKIYLLKFSKLFN